ncbi:MAG TPA: methyltransferase domain-containing protein [Ignavibacteriaceae bacterium]|nr:methyltransferase domain-containing protein [Ignavibacteriaceae bacterium]
MHYDPVKDVFASAIKKNPSLRILFYKLLDMMFLRSWYVRRELKAIRIKLNGKLNIYDAGTGYGQYSYFMAKKLQPNKIYAVDVKENWIKDCETFFKAKGFKEVAFGIEDLTEIKHKEQFDLIVCVDVMEHIVEDVKVFSNYYNALKTGGVLLINTPSIFGGSDVHDDDDESFVGEHARDGYSFEDLRDKLSPLGFHNFKHKYSYGYWGDKAWRLGIKYPMLALNKSKVLLLLLPFYYLVTLIPVLILMFVDYNSNNKVGSGITFIAEKK